MLGDPAIGQLFGQAKRCELIRPGNVRPRCAELEEDAIDGRGACKYSVGTVDSQKLVLGLRSRKRVRLYKPWSLTGDGEHTAAMVARSHPARAPRSKASSAVEEQDQGRPRPVGLAPDGFVPVPARRP